MVRGIRAPAWLAPTCLALALSALALPVAAGVYKWVDEDGRVHFGDRPGAQGAAKVDIQPAPAAAPGVPAGTLRDRAERQRRLTSSMESERIRRTEAREKAKADKAERARRCARARDRMRRFNEAGYIYDLDNSGNRRVFSAAERARADQRVRQSVQKWCG